MTALPTPPAVGTEAEGGMTPPGSPPLLQAFCDSCGKSKRASELTLVGGQPSHAKPYRWALICGECFTA